ncbi:MAG: hypothetical protein J5908_00965 [Selenomonas sp.]|nr:hypothetical protein [Selenomonas sp.]
MKVITRKYKLEKWKAIITNQMASGLTAAEYCRQEDLPISTFFYWKRTIRQELIAQMDTQVSKPAIVEVPLTVSETPLEEAQPAPPIEQNKLTLKWASVTLEVYPDTPQKLLRETLQSLQEVFPCS